MSYDSNALAAIGKIKDVVSKKAESPLQILATNIAMQIISRLKQSGIEQGLSTNAILLQSIAPTITETNTGVTINISANEYWDFVNSGVDGYDQSAGATPNYKEGKVQKFKSPFPNRKMAKNLQNGMAAKGLSLPPGFKDFESYSYAAATKVKIEGIKPNHFADKVLTPEFINEISLSLAEELGKKVLFTINENK